ncbi:MAG: hypothetical protein HYU64_09185 [Armatimonadetes bacterium]|nr:hypothetical protein [Armatimonadota bacterium]
MIPPLFDRFTWPLFPASGSVAGGTEPVVSPMSLKSLRSAVGRLYEREDVTGRGKPWVYENGEIGVADPPVQSPCHQVPLNLVALKRALDRIEDKYPQYRGLKPTFSAEANGLVSITLGEDGAAFRVNSNGLIVSTAFP